MCCDGQKQESCQNLMSQGCRSWKLNEGGLQCLCFSPTSSEFWCLKGFWDDQNKYVAMSSVSTTVGQKPSLCQHFPKYHQEWTVERYFWQIFLDFPSCPTSGAAGWWMQQDAETAETSDWWSAACELLFHDCSAEWQRAKWSVVRFLTLGPPPAPGSLGLPLFCTPPTVYPSVTFLTFLKVRSLSLPPRLCLRSPFGLRW